MKKFVIIPKTELDDVNSTIDFDQLPYTDKTVLRYSLDGTQAVIKYETPLPDFFSGKTTYTYSQITAILAGTDWTEVVTPEDVGL